jgi:hypothetical protein
LDHVFSDGAKVRIIQTSWFDSEMNVFGDHTGGQLFCKPVKDSLGVGIDRQTSMTVKPDFCLQRNQSRGPRPSQDKRNVLYGLIAANVPAINSFMSEYMQLERPLMLGALREIRDRVGYKKFPLNEITYYSSSNTMIIAPEMPAVLKLSHAHAGQGKIKVENQTAFEDMRTVLISFIFFEFYFSDT